MKEISKERIDFIVILKVYGLLERRSKKQDWIFLAFSG